MKFHKPLALWVLLLGIPLAGVAVGLTRCSWQPDSSAAQGPAGVNELAPGGNLQQAINRARPGDTIVLKAGEVYKGPITLPVKNGSEFITIQSSKISELPEGERVSPSQSVLLAKIVSATNSAPIVKTEPGAHHYKFVGIEFSTATAEVKVHDLIRLGDSDTQTTLDSVPYAISIDRSYIHGFPTQEVQRGISLNSRRTDITNSYISDVHGVGYDTQAICGWNGPGDYTIINNYLEGAGENVMFGGSDPKIPDLVPTKIEIRKNYFFKPLSWKQGDPSYAGRHWTVKNLFELKNARGVTIDGNIFQNNWVDAQAGSGVLFTVRNQDGTAPWSTIEEVTFTNNIVINSPSALNLLGKDNLQPSKQAFGLTISNNFFIGISGTFLTINGYKDVKVSNNTHFQSGNVMMLYGEQSPGFVYEKNVTIRDNNGYGVKGDATGEGTIALGQFAPGYKFANNVIVGANASQYPPNNAYPGSAKDIGTFTTVEGVSKFEPGTRYKDAGVNFAVLPKLPKSGQ